MGSLTREVGKCGLVCREQLRIWSEQQLFTRKECHLANSPLKRFPLPETTARHRHGYSHMLSSIPQRQERSLSQNTPGRAAAVVCFGMWTSPRDACG